MLLISCKQQGFLSAQVGLVTQFTHQPIGAETRVGNLIEIDPGHGDQ